MERKNRNILVVLIAAVIGLAVLASFGLSLFYGDLDPIVLPTAPAGEENEPPGGVSDSAGLVRVEVSPDTVQNVIATLSRPDSYYREVTLEEFWGEDGSGVTTAKVWADHGWTKTEAVWSTGTVRTSIVGAGQVWWWYGNGASFIQAPADGRSADLEGQRLPTYEDVLDLDKSRITDARYVEREGLSCIYVEAVTPSLGYVDRYWVSEESGLLVAAETLDGEQVVSRLSSYAVERPVPSGTVYTLPDGTVLHTVGDAEHEQGRPRMAAPVNPAPKVTASPA